MTSEEKNVVYENVAHDLRTPLVSILGYADALISDYSSCFRSQ